MQNSRLISAIRLPSDMFSEQAGTEVGSDLIVLKKQSGKEVGEGLEKRKQTSKPNYKAFKIALPSVKMMLWTSK